jgi:hypothetical protein
MIPPHILNPVGINSLKNMGRLCSLWLLGGVSLVQPLPPSPRTLPCLLTPPSSRLSLLPPPPSFTSSSSSPPPWLPLISCHGLRPLPLMLLCPHQCGHALERALIGSNWEIWNLQGDIQYSALQTTIWKTQLENRLGEMQDKKCACTLETEG